MSALTLEESCCYLCGASERRLWGREKGYACWKCAACGLVYVSPRPTAGAITDANRMGEHRTEAGALDVRASRSQRKVERYKRIFRAMYADAIAAGRPLSWLDVGAGYGEAIEALGALMPAGSRVLGIEPMAAKVAVARARGLPITQTDLAGAGETFDFVSLINVFSHIPDFGDFLVKVARLLRPGGSLFLETGNAGDLESSAAYPDALFLPDHLMFGGIATLEAFLRPAGFRIEAARTERRDTLLWSMKSAVKLMLGREAKLVWPYASPYRIIFVRAKLQAP